MKVLLVADLHLRADRPLCRLDNNWMESQRTDLENIGDIIKEKDVEQVWLLGDIFHRHNEPPKVVNMFLTEVGFWNTEIWSIAGNHDLPYHNAELKNDSCYGTVSQFMGDLADYQDSKVAAYDFGTEYENSCPIVVTHQLVFPNESARGLSGGKVPSDIKKEYPEAKLVLMGDYHDGWDIELGGQKQVMVGCMNIQSAKLKDYKPRVAIIDTDTYEVEYVYLPQDHVKVTDEHLVEAKNRDERIEACLGAIESVGSTEFDFVQNLRELGVRNNKLKGLLSELLEELVKRG